MCSDTISLETAAPAGRSDSDGTWKHSKPWRLPAPNLHSVPREPQWDQGTLLPSPMVTAPRSADADTVVGAPSKPAPPPREGSWCQLLVQWLGRHLASLLSGPIGRVLQTVLRA